MKDSDLTRYEANRDLAADLLKAVREMNAGKLHVVLSPVVGVPARTSGWFELQTFRLRLYVAFCHPNHYAKRGGGTCLRTSHRVSGLVQRASSGARSRLVGGASLWSGRIAANWKSRCWQDGE